MVNFRLILSIIFLMFYLTGCKCIHNDCPPYSSFHFEVVDENQNHLIKGNYPYRHKLTNDSIRVYGVIANNELKEIELYVDITKIVLPLDYDIKNYVIKYSFTEDDSLYFNMKQYSDECCSKIVTDFEIWINDSKRSKIPYDSAYLIIK